MVRGIYFCTFRVTTAVVKFEMKLDTSPVFNIYLSFLALQRMPAAERKAEVAATRPLATVTATSTSPPRRPLNLASSVFIPPAVHGWHLAAWHWWWQRSCSPFTRDKTGLERKRMCVCTNLNKRAENCHRTLKTLLSGSPSACHQGKTLKLLIFK